MAERIVQLPNIGKGGAYGRWGNSLVHYAFGHWYAQLNVAEVQTPEWLGKKVFGLSDNPIASPVNVTEANAIPLAFNGTIALDPPFHLPLYLYPHFANRQFMRRLFDYTKLPKPAEIPACAVHWRRTDFWLGTGWPQVPLEFILGEAKRLGFENATVVTDDGLGSKQVDDPERFLVDWAKLVYANVLFTYPSSSFSRTAALIGNGRIFEPQNYSQGQTTCNFIETQCL